MVDKNEDAFPKHFVLPDFELVERARKLHEQMRVLEKQLSANKEFQEKGLAKITSHMTTSKDR